VGLGGCILSMKLFHTLKSPSIVSTWYSCVLLRYVSLLQMGVLIYVFNLCSTRCKESSVSEINLAVFINLISINPALTSQMTSIEFMLRFLLLSTYSTIVSIDDSFSKSIRGSILNCVSRLLDDFHNSFLVTLACSWVFLISFIITIPDSFLLGSVLGEIWWISCHLLNSRVDLLGLLVFFFHIFHLQAQFHLIRFVLLYFLECVE